MSQQNMSVARVKRYTSAGIGKSERHNERKNDSYENLNVVPERIDMNVHFKDPGEQSYMEILKEMESSGQVSLRGLRQDATLFDEMIIDVNTMYFETHGGYEYAKSFYEEAFHFAEKKFGAENIISAVMHADEINQAATDQCGHPVYHYHLHVIALPVVEKEIRWSKRCRDESLRGAVKEVIRQISHSKKWESKTPELDEKGEPVLRANGNPKYRKSYSILQDELFEHMSGAGFRDFSRGERGSTAEHLEPTQFKIKKDQERLDRIRKQIQIEKVQYTEHHQVFKMYSELESMGKKTLGGKISMTREEFSDLTSLAKEGIASRSVIADLKEDVNYFRNRYYRESDAFRNLEQKYLDLREKCRPFLEALEHFPDLAKLFAEKVRELLERKRSRNQPDRSKDLSANNVRRKTWKHEIER